MKHVSHVAKELKKKKTNVKEGNKNLEKDNILLVIVPS